jgi:RHS repeat-associated protein
LKNAQHYRLGDESWISDNSYSEKNISYDQNGNITKLARYASNAALIDNLTYGYLDNGNQIGYVKDTQGDVPGVIDYPGSNSTAVDFYYDRNGNMTIDRDKGINNPILYSYLNKPEQIEFGNGEKIIYLYDGTGVKLGKKVVRDNAIQSASMIYIDNFVYNWTGKLQYILTDEGRLVPDSTTYLAEYFMKDHLGNTRAVYAYAAPGVAQVEEYQHYYPFGMQLEGLCHTTGVDIVNKQLYNGKELQTEYGLQWYDYGARFYDSQLGRWHVIDPHAENYYSWSPYHYAANNPIIVTDPTGMDWYTSTDGSATMWKEGSNEIVGYTNIGVNYTQNIGSGTSVTYTQNEATSMTFTGIGESNFVAQGTGTGCKIASDQMLASEGVNSNGERINIVNADANGVATTETANATSGINAVDKALEDGNPIEVGVDYKPKQVNNLKPNGDGMTDHFIVVSSKTETLSNGQATSKTYNFFDPRSSANGTSSSNTLQISNNKMTGHYLGGTASSIPYTVTTVRRSRK